MKKITQIGMFVALFFVVVAILLATNYNIKNKTAEFVEQRKTMRSEPIFSYSDNGDGLLSIQIIRFETHSILFLRFGEDKDVGIFDTRKVKIIEVDDSEAYFVGEFIGNGVDFFPLSGVLYVPPDSEFYEGKR